VFPAATVNQPISVFEPFRFTRDVCSCNQGGHYIQACPQKTGTLILSRIRPAEPSLASPRSPLALTLPCRIRRPGLCGLLRLGWQADRLTLRAVLFPFCEQAGSAGRSAGARFLPTTTCASAATSPVRGNPFELFVSGHLFLLPALCHCLFGSLSVSAVS
jgi:hypothetical protein